MHTKNDSRKNLNKFFLEHPFRPYKLTILALILVLTNFFLILSDLLISLFFLIPIINDLEAVGASDASLFVTRAIM